MERKGYGYVRVPETREEFHFREKALSEPVKKGDRVVFEIKENKQGLFAVHIRKMSE